MKRFLCLDIGTSSLKGGLLDERGTLVFYRRIPFAWSGDPQAEWTASAWVRAVRRLVADLPAAAELSGLVVSGNGPSLVAVDARGRPLAPVLRWNDGRGERRPGSASFFLPKAAWFRAERPELFERTRLFLGCPEYLVYEVTGRPLGISASVDFDPHLWSASELADHQLDAGLFPELVRPATFAGAVRPGPRGLGLPEGLPVYAGGPDFLMTLLGTATVVPGRVCDRTGTSEGLNYCSAAARPSGSLRCLPHVVPGLYNVAAILSDTGLLFEWYRRLTRGGRRPYETMVEDLHAVWRRHRPEGLPKFFPSTHHGERWQFAQGTFTGLGAGHGPDEIGWAVLEAIGFAVREAVEILERSDAPVEALRVSGGQARNDRWNQIKADICGREVLAPLVVDAELSGNLACALAARGLYADAAQAAEAVVSFPRVYTPDPEAHRRYTDSYLDYRGRFSRLGLRLA